ncbi:MAG TPA: hypothetical protein PKV71_06870 [Calditrichia bacterium]|nr:hypothetical protein [Calditrichia bacterium]
MDPFFQQILQQWAAGEESAALLFRAGRIDPRLVPLLAEWYEPIAKGITLTNLDGHTFPALAFPASGKANGNPQNLLGSFFPDGSTVSLTPAQNTLLAALRRRIPHIWDGPVYDMETLSLTDGIPSLSARPGGYFANLATGELVELELLAALGSTTANPAAPLAGRLAQRRLLQAHENPIFSARFRCAAAGLSAIIVCRDQTRRIVLMRFAAPKFGPQFRVLHALPSLMMEPATGRWTQEFDVHHNFFREYLEEVFDAPEQRGEGLPLGFFENHPAQTFLRSFLDRREAQLIGTGIAVDLLKLRPEICTLLLVENPAWLACHQAGRDPQGNAIPVLDIGSALRRGELLCRQPQETPLPPVGIADQKWVAFPLGEQFDLPAGLVRPGWFNPAGGAALTLAIQWLRKNRA